MLNYKLTPADQAALHRGETFIVSTQEGPQVELGPWYFGPQAWEELNGTGTSILPLVIGTNKMDDVRVTL